MSKNPTPLDRVRDFEREQAMKLSAEERAAYFGAIDGKH